MFSKLLRREAKKCNMQFYPIYQLNFSKGKKRKMFLMKQEKKTSFEAEGDAILMKREIPCFHGVFQVLFCKIHSGRRQEPKDKGSIMGHLMSTYIL